MKPAEHLKSLPAAALAVLLLLAPFGASAQRRRARTQRRASAPARTNPPAPPAAGQPAARGRQQPAAAAAGARTQTPARAAQAPAPEAEDEKGASEIDLPFEDVVGAERYALVFELRALGQFVRSKEMGELLDMLRVVGGGVKEMEQYLDFYTSNAEQLDDVKTFTAAMPTRAGLPQFVGAYQFPTAEAAKSFEPKVRGAMEKYERSQASAPTTAGGEGAPGPKPGAAEMNRPGAAHASPRPQASPPVPKLVIKRYGRLIFMGSEPFTLKSFKGREEAALSQNARYQSLRGRLSSEPLFLYLDVTLLEKTTEVEREQMERARKEQETASGTGAADGAAQEREEREAMARAEMEALKAAELARANDPGQVSGGEEEDPEEGGPLPQPDVMVGNTAAGVGTGDAQVIVGTADGEQQRGDGEAELSSSRAGGFLMSMIFGMGMSGAPRWPSAVGAALALDRDSFVVRAVLVNPDAGPTHPVPFLPMLISGPLITPQAAGLAPADTDIFINLSLDLTQMYNRMLASMEESFGREAEARKTLGESDPAEAVAAAAGAGGAEATIAAAEKLMGFKIKDDLLPALGNEVAVSLPLKWVTGETGYNYGYRPGSREERQGAVVLVALNNAEAVRRMLPRVLEFAGLKSLTAPEQAVSHGGVQIHVYGSLAVAYVGSFMALAWDVPSIKRLIDAGSSQGALASDERFRAATSWSPRQKIAEVYVSRALAESFLGELTKWADPKDAEVNQLLTRLNIKPEPAAYAVTDEGGGTHVHELRLPTAVVKYFAAESALGRKFAPVKQGENSALSTLTTIREMQNSHKTGRGKGSYATLEELAAPAAVRTDPKATREYEHPLSKPALERLGYRFDLTVAGDKYAVTATPKEPGKNGRRSFFMDETGVIRAADRAGEPANANDPPVD